MDLKKLREAKGLTQAEVASRAGISIQFYRFLEGHERRASVETAMNLAMVLGFDWKDYFESCLDVKNGVN